jgi:hypothetical protein
VLSPPFMKDLPKSHAETCWRDGACAPCPIAPMFASSCGLGCVRPFIDVHPFFCFCFIFKPHLAPDRTPTQVITRRIRVAGDGRDLRVFGVPLLPA